MLYRMCGRFALTVPHEAVAEIFDVPPNPALIGRGPRYNICPTQEIEAVRLGEDGRELTRFRWGYIPHWFKTPSDGPLLINARSETIASKSAFAESARFRRCLIPASGFYEWRASAGKGKEPYWIHPSNNNDLIAWAGIWREWEGADGQHLSTCAIVTTAASETLSSIHHRLPLSIAPDDWALWLGEQGKGAARLMTPPTDNFWSFHQVDPIINKIRSDGPSLIEPFEETRLI
ncbi:MAG: SOS response-associated peptidase [Pikeienuella sp.]